MENQDRISAKDFCTHHQIEISFINSLHSYGLLEIQQSDDDYFLEPEQLGAVEKMIRLHYDLAINFEGIDVIKNLLEQMEGMRREITTVRTRLRIYETE